MTQPRRSMSQALQTADLSPEAVAFIKEGTPKPKVEKPVLTAVEGRGPKEEEPSALPVQPAETKPKAPKRERPRGEPKALPPESLVSASFRLPGAVMEGLLQAATDRKLKRITPHSQQDIVREAVTGWLREEGYLKSGAE